jgi:hypothetical protein
VIGGLRKLHNDELYNVYSFQSKIRKTKSMRMKMVGHVARMGKRRILAGKPEGKSTRKTKT